MRSVFEFLRRHSAPAMFAAGFLFDFFTLQRIDAWLDLAFQLAYLAGLTALLVFQHREAEGRWVPGKVVGRVWQYNVEALHFLYGGLLSAYVVLYFRSSTGARPALFLALLVGVMGLNEVPRIRRAGYTPAPRSLWFLRALLSYLLLPDRPGTHRRVGVPAVAAVVGGRGVAGDALARAAPTPKRDDGTRRRLFAPAAGVLLFIGVLYLLRLIPPVPLSVQFQGIYHDVRREDGGYTLVYQEPPPWEFWRRDSRTFVRREGDRLHYFARVFAPTGFEHRVIIRWEFLDPSSEPWTTTDRVPLDVVGGRAEGFRGFAVKSNFTAGRWRVTAETEDGRAIATLPFRVEEDAGTGERQWKTLRA